MVLKRRLSYHWRLFLPLVLLVWTLIGGLFYFQYKREKGVRAELLRSQVSFINDRVIAAFESDFDIRSFLDFVKDYENGSMYENLRLSVYNVKTGELLDTIGQPLPINAATDSRSDILDDIKTLEGRGDIKGPDLFFTSASTSRDGRYRSIMAIPYNVTMVDALKAESDLWIVILTIAIITTIVAYLSTRYMSRNIRVLRDFTDAAANNEIITDVKLPNDELGDISRQIINIFNKRSQALKGLEYEHRVALRATQEKARIKRELTNNINHELKTPIGIIKGYIDTILENPEMDEEQKTVFLQKVQANVDRLCGMMNDLSTITRLEENGDKISKEPIDFHELVFTVADEVRESGMIGSMTFTYDIPMECVVKGNYNLLRGMLMNLIKNAVAYSKGTETGIKVVSENDRFYTFSFYDNGVGVEDKHLPYLFDRFYRVDSGRSRKTGGTGLGLPIIKNSVVSMGGTISVNNREGGGLGINFTLPKDKLG